MEKQTKAYIYAILAVLFWSTAGTAFKLSLEFTDYINLLFFATLSSLIVFSVILSIKKQWYLIKIQTKKDIISSAINGLLNPFLYYFILFQAYDILLAQEALTLNYLWPVVLILLSIPILKQKISILSLIAVLISFFGFYIIASGGDLLGLKFTNTKGVILALASTVIWALFWLLNLKDKREGLSKMFMNFVFGFIYISIAILVLNKFSIPSINALLGSAYIGIFEMGITFVFWLKALSLSKTTAKVSNLVYIAPFLSLIIISIILNEDIKTSTILGISIIILGIIMEKYSNRVKL